MPRKKRPLDDVTAYMRFFPKDWLAAVMGCNAEERGAYMSILALMWENHGRLVMNHRQLASACGVERDRWSEVWDGIRGFFNVEELVESRCLSLTQKRVGEEREHAIAARKQRSDAGKASAESRKQKRDAAKSAEQAGSGSTAVAPSLDSRTSLAERPSDSRSPSVATKVNDPHPSTVTLQRSGSLGDLSEGGEALSTSPSSSPPTSRTWTARELAAEFGRRWSDTLKKGLPCTVTVTKRLSEFAEGLSPDVADDVIPTMDLALGKIKRRDAGWGGDDLEKAVVALTAWLTAFPDLVNERRNVRGARAPAAAAPRAPGARAYRILGGGAA